MGASFNFYTKKAHRYLGVFIGLQFVMWTVGGFYFSWTNINEIRGDHLRKTADAEILDFNLEKLASPTDAVLPLLNNGLADKITGIRLSKVLGEPVYEISFEHDGRKRVQLANALTGDLLPKIDKEEAVKIANEALAAPSNVLSNELITEENVGGHHEYREKPLPAYAITYAEPANLVVYVGKDTGRVESVRTTEWRVFDFFWLFHTLDFYGRDNINNYVLRAFSVLGLVTIASGYILFFITSPWFRKKRSKDKN